MIFLCDIVNYVASLLLSLLPPAFCSGYDGTEPLLQVDSSNLYYSRSANDNQPAPALIVRSSQRGYAGNVRVGHPDLGQLSLSLVPRNTTAAADTQSPRPIGMQSVQVGVNIVL